MFTIEPTVSNSNNRTENLTNQTPKLKRRELDRFEEKNTEIKIKISLGGQLLNIAPFNIDQISESLDGTEIHFSSVEDEFLKAVFRFNGCYGFRYYATLDIDKYLQEYNIMDSGLYQLNKSEHLDWATNSVLQTAKTIGLSNFLIVSNDNVVDVLSYDQPTFSMLD